MNSSNNVKTSVPRHMTDDDPFPEKTPGKLRLYYMQYCPYALRARMMLSAKGVDFETINIHLRRKPKWFLEKFPSGTVPVIEIDDKLLGESLVISEYVDDVYSNPGENLVPADPYKRARQRMLITNFFPKVISVVYKRLQKKEGWEEPFYEQFDEVERVLGEKMFFSGDAFGYADYMIWPWMRYFGSHCIDDALTPGKFPNLERWLEDARSNNVIVETSTPPEIIGKFAEGYSTGNFVYDLE